MEAVNNGTPVGARQTRGALADLSRQLADVSVTLMTTPDTNNRLPSSMMTPTPSPEEMIIQLRGRKNPVTWSPLSITRVQKLAHSELTPIKDPAITRSMLGLRSSPRKRLQLGDPQELSDMFLAEKSKKLCSPSPKKQKIGDNCSPVSLNAALKGLTKTQLIEIIQNLASGHEEVRKELQCCLPKPDLQPLFDELTYLQKNIFKSLPHCRLSSKTDSSAFNKVAIHLSALKKCILGQGKQLIESGHWNSIIDYTLIAWNIVRGTPLWDNAQHNSHRRQCFKFLSSSCLKALKNMTQSLEWKLKLKQQLERLQADEKDLDVCIMYLDAITDVEET